MKLFIVTCTKVLKKDFDKPEVSIVAYAKSKKSAEGKLVKAVEKLADFFGDKVIDTVTDEAGSVVQVKDRGLGAYKFEVCAIADTDDNKFFFVPDVE